MDQDLFLGQKLEVLLETYVVLCQFLISQLLQLDVFVQICHLFVEVLTLQFELSSSQNKVFVGLVSEGPDVALILQLVFVEFIVDSLLEPREAHVHYLLDHTLQLAEPDMVGGHCGVDYFLNVLLLQRHV